MSRRIWGFLHPRDFFRKDELTDFLRDIRVLLADARASVMDANLRAAGRRAIADRIDRVNGILDKLTK